MCSVSYCGGGKANFLTCSSKVSWYLLHSLDSDSSSSGQAPKTPPKLPPFLDLGESPPPLWSLFHFLTKSICYYWYINLCLPAACLSIVVCPSPRSPAAAPAASAASYGAAAGAAAPAAWARGETSARTPGRGWRRERRSASGGG